MHMLVMLIGIANKTNGSFKAYKLLFPLLSQTLVIKNVCLGFASMIIEQQQNYTFSVPEWHGYGRYNYTLSKKKVNLNN